MKSDHPWIELDEWPIFLIRFSAYPSKEPEVFDAFLRELSQLAHVIQEPYGVAMDFRHLRFSLTAMTAQQRKSYGETLNEADMTIRKYLVGTAVVSGVGPFIRPIANTILLLSGNAQSTKFVESMSEAKYWLLQLLKAR